MPISYQDAYDATNPELQDTQRDESARRIMAGVAANDAYWDSRSELEALRARHEGHGVVVAPTEEDAPTVGGTSTDPTAVDSTATEESGTALESGETGNAVETSESKPDNPEPPKQTVPPSPDNPTEAVAKLRAQVTALGGNPEA